MIKGSFSQFLPLLLVGAFAITILTALLAFHNLSVIQSDSNWVIHSREVIAQSERLFSSIKDAESEARGYFVSGNSSFILRYTQAKKNTNTDFSSLFQLVSDKTSQQHVLNSLHPLIEQRFARLDMLINIYQTQGFDAVSQSSQGSVGTNLMDRIESDINVFGQNEQILLTKRKNDLSRNIQQTYLVTLISTILLLLFVYGAYLMIRRELRIREDLEIQKNEFINMASHELKTPLTSLRVFVQVLKRRLEKEHDLISVSYTQKIDAQVMRMREMITDLLDLTRIQTGKLLIKRENFDLVQLIEELVDVFSASTSKHHISFLGKKHMFVYADRYRIYQVLVNLLTNAIKYSPKGGSVKIKVREVNQNVEVSISDRGIGIDKANKNRIFDRLYQVKDDATVSIPGLGIGLYITAEIIRGHHGKIWVESKKGHGSTFYFTLRKAQKEHS